VQIYCIGDFFVVKYREILRLHAQEVTQGGIVSSCGLLGTRELGEDPNHVLRNGTMVKVGVVFLQVDHLFHNWIIFLSQVDQQDCTTGLITWL